MRGNLTGLRATATETAMGTQTNSFCGGRFRVQRLSHAPLQPLGNLSGAMFQPEHEKRRHQTQEQEEEGRTTTRTRIPRHKGQEEKRNGSKPERCFLCSLGGCFKQDTRKTTPNRRTRRRRKSNNENNNNKAQRKRAEAKRI